MDPPLTSHVPPSAAALVGRNGFKPWYRRAIGALLLIIAFYTIVVLKLSVYGPGSVDSQPAGTPTEIDRRLHDCIHNELDIVGHSRPEVWLYREVWYDCAREIYSVDTLLDFDIRREKLLRKELDERVLLWMVVAVTMSGVAFAGVQIWLSYNLAMSGLGEFAKDTEMSVKSGELALRSSVTGLFILAFSLAFFVSYVKWIYTDQEIVMPHPEVSASPMGPTGVPGSIDRPGTIGPSTDDGSSGNHAPPSLLRPAPPAAQPEGETTRQSPSSSGAPAH